MSETKHTPGPWAACETEPRGDFCIHAKGIPQQLAYVAASSVVDWPLGANARLIAAAPDLFAFAAATANTYDESWAEGSQERRIGDEARAAIAKAVRS